MKTLKTELLDLDRHPEPDLGIFESCGTIVREAAEKAAQHGRIDIYEEFKNVRHCSARDGLAILAHIEYELKPNTGDLLTVAEAAERLKVSPKKIYRLVNSGQLSHHRVGRSIRILPDDLEQFIQKRSGAQRSKSKPRRHLSV